MTQENSGIVVTKEEKIARIKAQISRLVQKLDDVENDRVTAKAKAKKVIFVPEVGATVLATVGRNTATSQAQVVEGVVVAVKLPPEGSKGSVQVRVRINAGQFDEQTVTLYPAQLTANRSDETATQVEGNQNGAAA